MSKALPLVPPFSVSSFLTEMGSCRSYHGNHVGHKKMKTFWLKKVYPGRGKSMDSSVSISTGHGLDGQGFDTLQGK
jgi:hypothetical protein